MIIHKNFLGGNIEILKQNENEIYLETEKRDSIDDWFYWAFCAEGAAGKEVTFHFADNRLGYFGPAVSHDLKNWRWLNNVNINSFTYKFCEDENKVYFAHDILYHPNRFFDFLKEKNVAVLELCKSRKGRSVPYLKIGNGKTSIILTARHHACESTGSYVLEGVLDEAINNPFPDSTVFCVPFVDYDGVIDGDQGKGRAPYDHNRDYGFNIQSIYPSCAKIREYADKYGCNFGFDFHSPWHKGDQNDTAFIVQNNIQKQDRFIRFGKILESLISEKSFEYKQVNDYPPNTGWNMGGPQFAVNMINREECELAFTFETAYFGTDNNKVSPDRLVELGKCFARSLKKYCKGVK